MTGTRVPYISDSIGLGHAARDLAIARELRALNQEVEFMWLAGDPASRLIAEAGETFPLRQSPSPTKPVLLRTPLGSSRSAGVRGTLG